MSVTATAFLALFCCLSLEASHYGTESKMTVSQCHSLSVLSLSRLG